MKRHKKNLSAFLTIFFILLSYRSFAETKEEKVFQGCIEFMKGKNYKKAENCFLSSYKATVGHYPSIFNLALINLETKNNKQCLKYLDEAKKYNPYDIRLDRMYSLLFMQGNNYDNAKKYLSAIILKKPDDIPSHKKLGIIFLNEDNLQAAASEFTMAKNLSPSDTDNVLLLSMSYFLQGQFKEALEKISNIKDKIKDDLPLAYYGYALEKNGNNSESQTVLSKTTFKEKEKIIESLKMLLLEKTYNEERGTLSPIENYENPQVTQRIIEKTKKEQPQAFLAQQMHATQKKKKWWDLKGEFNQTIEYYDRSPGSSSPINRTNTTSNLKIEGKTSGGASFSSQLEWFYNRWDHTDLDYYKVNIARRDNWEVDVGKFSAKNFPSLVSYPTVLDGMRVWKKLKLPKFEVDKMELPDNIDDPVNLGEIYDETHNDHRLFKYTEIVAVVGRTLKAIDLNERKQKNEDTYESSGQFEQWTHAYRLTTQLNGFMDIGASAAFTRDRPYSAEVSSSTITPISSAALGIDGGMNFFDKKLLFDWEVATSNYNEDMNDEASKHKQDRAWVGKITYKPLSTTTLSYEQKYIGKNFEVEGAYQTEDKVTHTMDLSYKPKNPKTWMPQSLTVKFQPEESNVSGGGDTKKRYKTFQSVLDIKLPQDNKYSFDYKYYREWDKCNCSDYITLTFKNSIDWEIKDWKTTIKPTYTFERKDDYSTSATDEKLNDYELSIENKSINNLTLKYSFEREEKTYRGYTTKEYYQHIHSIEAKYDFIPSRSDLTFKASSDFKEPTDTNETDITVLSCAYNYTTKDRNNKFTLSYERKNNIYLPWSETSAYRQDYVKFKYTRKF